MNSAVWWKHQSLFNKMIFSSKDLNVFCANGRDPLQQLNSAAANFQKQLRKVQTSQRTPSNHVPLVLDVEHGHITLTWGSGLKIWIWVVLCIWLSHLAFYLPFIFDHVCEDFHPKNPSTLCKHVKFSTNEPNGTKLPLTISESNTAVR